MSKKQKCFISYNRSDNDFKTVQSFVSYLNESCDGTIDFLIDEELTVGSDLNDFMKGIKNVDAVIMLLTPEYKRKVEERVASGVFIEFRHIVDRLEELSEAKRAINGLNNSMHFAFIPIVFSRNFSESCPTQLRNHRCLDFTDFHVRESGKLLNSVVPKYTKLFREIVSEINTVKSLNKPSVQRKYQETLKILFQDTKHNKITASNFGDVEALYVKTNSFYNVRQQQTHFFLGRKGSGKSTLGPLLFTLDRNTYKEHIEIDVDHLNLEYLFNITLSKSINRDVGIIISYADYFMHTWKIFIYLRCFEVIIQEFKRNNLNEYQNKFIPVIDEFMNSFGQNAISNSLSFAQESDNAEKLNAIFQWCTSKVALHIENAIVSSSNEEPNFHYELNNLLTPENILLSIIPKNVLASFHSITKTCVRYFLISFDGFDTMFEKFRIESSSQGIAEGIKVQRVKLETGFLEGFLNLINEIKLNKLRNNFYDKIHFCVTVPKDRFFEIKDAQRDSYRYINKFQEIKWTGIELSILLRKRLELLQSYRTNKDLTAIDRLYEVMEETLPTLPMETQINIGEKQFVKDTFLNVIRHSFWRPREILIYYSKIITVIDDLKRRSIKPDNFTVSKIISETTFDIIGNEFISEFQNYCTNLKTILSQFKDSQQIISFEQLHQKIGKVHFQFIDTIEPQKDIFHKIDFLFEIGFLGFEVSKSLLERFKFITQDIFCFNSGSKTYDILKSNNFDNCKFVIHPIFCEYLSLDTSTQDRLTLDIRWEYLTQQDIFYKL